jgi:hypothetical protein
LAALLRQQCELCHAADRIIVPAAHGERTLIRTYDCDPVALQRFGSAPMWRAPRHATRCAS